MNRNKMIRVFTTFMLLFIVSLGNIGGCTNSENGDDTNPEPTPSASPPPPTPVPTPSVSSPPPTPVPTPAPTLPPQLPAPTPVPTIAPPMQETGQKNAATAIARVCADLIESASADETNEQLLAAYQDSVNNIMELDLPSGVSDLPVAIGTIRSALIVIAGRGNEELSELAEELAAMCEEDLNAL